MSGETVNTAPTWPERMKALQVGERLYIDVDYSRAGNVQSMAARAQRALTGREFTNSVFTAVSAARASDVRHLICIERSR